MCSLMDKRVRDKLSEILCALFIVALMTVEKWTVRKDCGGILE